MRTQHVLAAIASVVLLSACASAPVRPVADGLSDVPIIEEMTYVAERSTIIDGPSVKASRLVYRGRFEPQSVAESMRKGLEKSGWRHLNTINASNSTITQSYEKPGGSVHLVVWEGSWYTYVEVMVARSGATAQR